MPDQDPPWRVVMAGFLLWIAGVPTFGYSGRGRGSQG